MASQVQAAWRAAKLGDVATLRALVPSAVSPNASTFSRDNHAHTLLMSAVIHGAVECAEHLLDSGAAVDKKNFMGYTALHWTAFTGRIEAVDLLLSRGADIDARTADGQTVVHIAASRGHLQFLRAVADRGATLPATTATGWSGIHFSVVGNFLTVCQFLISRGVDPRALDAQKRTVLALAEKYKRSWFARLLAARPRMGEEEEEEEEP